MLILAVRIIADAGGLKGAQLFQWVDLVAVGQRFEASRDLIQEIAVKAEVVELREWALVGCEVMLLTAGLFSKLVNSISRGPEARQLTSSLAALGCRVVKSVGSGPSSDASPAAFEATSVSLASADAAVAPSARVKCVD